MSRRNLLGGTLAIGAGTALGGFMQGNAGVAETATAGAPPGRYVATGTVSALHDANPANDTSTAILHIVGLADTGAPITTIMLTAVALVLAGLFVRYAARRRRPSHLDLKHL